MINGVRPEGMKMTCLDYTIGRFKSIMCWNTTVFSY